MVLQKHRQCTPPSKSKRQTDKAMNQAQFLERVQVGGADECWPWLGASFETHGNRYGTCGSADLAHRVSFEMHNGPLADGLVVDHICRNGLCVNPSHLEAVTNVENIMRGNGTPAVNARKTHCKSGHPLEGNNLRRRRDGRRVCRTCEKERNAARYH